MTAVRNSLLLSLRQRVKELPSLIDALDLETDPGAAQERIDRLTAENEKLAAWLCFCPERPAEDFDPDEQCPVHGDPKQPRLTMRAALQETARWRSAFEALHARLLRDLPGDGSELPQPDDEYWARQLDGLVTYAGDLYHDTETEDTP